MQRILKIAIICVCTFIVLYVAFLVLDGPAFARCETRPSLPPPEQPSAYGCIFPIQYIFGYPSQ